MFPARVLSVAISVASLTVVQVRAAEKENEPLAIIELGGAGEWAFSGGSNVGPSAAVEFEPIKDWLEIELGTGPLFGRGRTEWSTDVLFKKPFTLSEKVELVDHGGNVAEQFGLAFEMNEAAKNVLKSFGLDLEKRNADGRWILPVPGTFVVDRLGKVVYAHVDPDYRNRPEPREIVATCRSLPR